MTKEELAKLCVDTYLEGVKATCNAIQSQIEIVYNEKQDLKMAMINTMLKNMDTK